MTEQNSTSIDRLSSSLPTSSHWDGKGDEDISTPRLNQAVHIALTQCQAQLSTTEENSGSSRALLASKGMNLMMQSYSPCYPHGATAVLKDEWQRLEQLKEDFLSTVSHELKTPLSSMYLSIQLLELLLETGDLLNPPEPTPQIQSAQSLHDQSDEADEASVHAQTSWLRQVHEKRTKIKQCLATLSNECKKEIVLINNLLLLQESRAVLPSPALACIFLHDWLKDILTPFYGQFKHKRHRFSCDVPSSLSYIIADCIRLEKILQELITNACKFTPDEGQISISIWEQENILMLTVLNKGETIPSDEIPNLFNIFYRIPRTDPWQEKGTGIGLALVKKWTESIGGEIRVATGSFGNAFTLYLPSTKQMKPVKA